MTQKSIAVGVVVLGVGVGIALLAKGATFEYSAADIVQEIVDRVPLEVPEKVLHVATPEAVKAIYMTSCVVGTPSFRDELVAVLTTKEFNSIVIDIKDYTGTLSYDPDDATLDHAWEHARCGARDMREFIAHLHELGIYVIGRVTVFQDPHMTARRPDLAVQFASTRETWKDGKGLSFTDVSAQEIWDYHIAIAKDAYAAGFDEINFDYVRFPSDGPMSDIYFPHSGVTPKDQALEKFFAYLHDNLKDTGIVTSADIFGMTTTATFDLNIGQVFERALPYFDYIAPMVYPSHYPPGFNGWADPNEYPYELIAYVMDEAVRRAESTTTPIAGMTHIRTSPTSTTYTKPFYSRDMLRTWIQDFDYGGEYGPAEVRAQIQGSYDAGVNSWMVWAPSNRYTLGAYEDATVD